MKEASAAAVTLAQGERRKSRAEADAAASRLALLNQTSRAFAGSDVDLDARLTGVAAELATALNSSITIGLMISPTRMQAIPAANPIG